MTQIALPILLSNVDRDTNFAPPNGDCACADVPLLAPVLRQNSCERNEFFQVPAETRLFPLKDEWQIVFQPSAHHVPIIVNPPAVELFSYFQTPHSIDDAACHFPYWERNVLENALNRSWDYELLMPVGITPERFPSAQSTLSVWLHATNACNLR